MSVFDLIPQPQNFQSECTDWLISNTSDENWAAYEIIQNLCLDMANSINHILDINSLNHTGSDSDSESEAVREMLR